MKPGKEIGRPACATTYQTRNGSNAFGIYDMAENAWEWINDWYSAGFYLIRTERGNT